MLVFVYIPFTTKQKTYLSSHAHNKNNIFILVDVICIYSTHSKIKFRELGESRLWKNVFLVYTSTRLFTLLKTVCVLEF